MQNTVQFGNNARELYNTEPLKKQDRDFGVYAENSFSSTQRYIKTKKRAQTRKRVRARNELAIKLVLTAVAAVAAVAAIVKHYQRNRQNPAL